MRSAMCCRASGLISGLCSCGRVSKSNSGSRYSPSSACRLGANKSFCRSGAGFCFSGSPWPAGWLICTATGLRLLLAPSTVSTSSAVMVFAVRTMRRANFAFGMSRTNWCGWRISRYHSHSSCAPAFSSNVSHDTCNSSESPATISTTCTKRLPETPSSRVKPLPSDWPIKPPAPIGRLSCNSADQAAASKSGLPNKSNAAPPKPMPK